MSARRTSTQYSYALRWFLSVAVSTVSQTRGWSLIMLACAVTAGASAADKHSGYDDAGSETWAMQDDDSANPGFPWMREGEAQ